MIKRITLAGVCLLVIFALITPVFADSTMSWDFELYGNIQAEAAALNMAKQQQELERFESMLRYRVLSRIASDIVGAAFGEEPLQEGEYVVGPYKVKVSSDETLIWVEMWNTETGDYTIVSVPYYEY